MRSVRQVSYLLGTIHIGFGFDEVLTPEARKAFEQSTRVWMEADVTAGDPKALIQAAFLPDDRSLHALVGDDVWGKLLEKLGSQIPPLVMDRLEPWMPSMILGLSRVEEVLLEMRPGAASKRMDLELMESARTAGKEIRFFETLEHQIAVFDAVPLEEQVQELTHTLSDESREQGRAMLRAFADGDEQALERALFESGQMSAAPGFYESLLFRRNATWLPLIEQELGRGGAFIAVGAAHLYGPRGILTELKKRWYVVRRVP